MNPRRAALAAAGLWLTAAALATAAAAADDQGRSAHLVHVARQRPPCTTPDAMPVAPNDPGALVTPQGTRCHGTHAPMLELWLPEDRYVWLERSGPNPAAWIDLGVVELDARDLRPEPLGLRLSVSGDTVTLETRLGLAATLTRLRAGTWSPVATPGGDELWVRLADAAETPDRRPRRRELGGGSVRYRAD